MTESEDHAATPSESSEDQTDLTLPDRYLGDGVYARFDGFQIWLTTEQGGRIALEPEVFSALRDYAGMIDRVLGQPYFGTG